MIASPERLCARLSTDRSAEGAQIYRSGPYMAVTYRAFTRSSRAPGEVIVTTSHAWRLLTLQRRACGTISYSPGHRWLPGCLDVQARAARRPDLEIRVLAG